MSFNLATILRESARRTPDSTVLRFGGSSLSYAELDELSSRCARGLRAQGLAPGDAVAVQLPNFPEFLVSYFGILKPGWSWCPQPAVEGAGDRLRPRRLRREARHLLRRFP